MKILFRADASPAMGTGHIMRCLALSEALIAAGGSCHFAVAETTDAIDRRLARSGVVVHRVDPDADRDASATIALAETLGAAAAVVDGYHLDAAWRRRFGQSVAPVLGFWDGEDPATLHADILVNAAAAHPPPVGGPDIRWLLGPRYVLLRREISAAARAPSLPLEQRRHVLLTLGGSDPLELTRPLAVELDRVLPPDLVIDVVVGGSVRHRTAVVADLTDLSPRLRVHLDPRDMGVLMRRSGLAVSAAGGTIGELAALGVPAILVIVAANQRQGALAAAAQGRCRTIDAAVDPADAVAHIGDAAAVAWNALPERATWAKRAGQAIDTAGARRVADALIDAAVQRSGGSLNNPLTVSA